jgi:hypothetical protein
LVTLEKQPTAQESMVIGSNRLKVLMASAFVLFGMFLLFYPTTQSAVTFRDYPAHIRFAVNMENGSIPVLTHPLFHIALIVTHHMGSLSWENAAVVVSLVAQVGLGLSIFGILIYRLPESNLVMVAVVALTFILMLVGAITFFTWQTERLYFGYLLPHVYHNPTTLILQPLSLLSFVYAVGIFSHAKHFKSNGAWLISAALVVMSALAKPSYIIAMIPAVGLFGLYRLVRGGTINWKLGILGLALPAGLILILQFALLPNSGSGADKIALMPFGFLDGKADMNLWFLQLLMSLAFPLSIYALNFKTARHELPLNLAWLGTGFALFYYYFVVETNRINAGNFTWSAQIMALILFVVSAKFLLDRVSIEKRITLTDGLSIAVLLLHFVCGVVWYVLNLSPADAKLYF